MSKINEALEYTKEFFRALEGKVDKAMRYGHACAKCGVRDGARKENRNGDTGKTRAIVTASKAKGVGV